MSLKRMRDYLFMDDDSGEQFFVECFSLREAWDIIHENFDDCASIEYIDEYSVEEAEILGYDTY